MRGEPIHKRTLWRLLPVMACAAAVATTTATRPAPVWAADGGFCLTVLHNNDAESQLMSAPGAEDFGGAARFVSKVRKERGDALNNGCKGLLSGDAGGDVRRGVVMVSSGDNFLAGPEFNASLAAGAPFFDSRVINAIGYDALALGNHEFDFGPEVLAEFISGVDPQIEFLSANLDFAQEPKLQAFVDSGRIAKSTVVTTSGEKIGIVGATTDSLNLISSPRNTVINEVRPAVQAEIDALRAAGVEIIVVISHLQGIKEDLALIPALTGVDVVIAGGGDELLVNSCDAADIVPTDAGDGCPFGPYPLTATNADGQDVPVVTTAGDLKYLGKLEVLFDGDGTVQKYGGDALRVAGGGNPDAVEADAKVESDIVDPVRAFVAELDKTVIATSDVALEGRRDPGIRTQETNLGDLTADSLLFQANRSASGLGLAPAHVALQNGGGIRNNNLIPAGDFTELHTFDILPFSNFVTIVKDIPRAQFKQILEHAYGKLPGAAGRFAQVAGFKVTIDTARSEDRIREVVLDDGTAIVQDGNVVAGKSVNIATIDFLARGGDGYPFKGAPFASVGVSYQQALSNFVRDSLNGKIALSDYPEGGEGRITILP